MLQSGFQNPVKYLRLRFVKIVSGFQPVTIFAKRLILDVWQGSEYASALKTCKTHEIFIFGFCSSFMYCEDSQVNQRISLKIKNNCLVNCLIPYPFRPRLGELLKMCILGWRFIKNGYPKTTVAFADNLNFIILCNIATKGIHLSKTKEIR